ncbi:MAG: ABC transporter substrate-binding protein [Chloroflexi bacterium]|nr:ABC transporter substrate-binding protein [Chloroflexota bacterium]MBU1752088.1 ABC transporter substrate-binding protein [Chloroflexota bacterium]
MQFKKGTSLGLVLTLIMIVTMLAAQCPPAPAPTVAPTQAAAGDATKVPPAEAVKIDFWFAMSGRNGEVIQELVTRFNESQSEVFVTATYQGSYDDAINKLKAGLQSKDVPAVVQVYDIGTRLLIDLKVATPVQDFVDREKFDISDIEPNVVNYYSVDGKLYSMPFNTSNPVLYYNKTLFKEAGLDPEKAPRTWAEVAEYSRKLTKKDASGKVTQYGSAFAFYGWFVEQFIAVQGGYYVNNENGRQDRATEAAFNGPEGVALLEWWKGMIDEGICANLGRSTADTKKAFDSGVAAMTLDSTAGLRDRIDAAEGKFEVGVGFLPRADEADYGKAGTIIGGACLWILNLRPTEEQEAAWKFVKFMSSAQSQAYWHINTGYYPINAKGYNEPDDVAWRAKYPQFQVAIDQLHIAPKNNVTAGGLIGVFPEARQTVEGALEECFAGGATPKDALDKAAKSVTQAIKDYNDSISP